MSPAQDPKRCRQCGTELIGTNRIAEQAHAAGLCSDCWLDAPHPEAVNVPHGHDLANRATAVGLWACRRAEVVTPAPSRPRTLAFHPQAVKDLIAAAYRILTTRPFRDCAGNPADPESSALQALLDGIDAVEGRRPRYVVQCQACDAVAHNGLKHGAGSSLGAVGAPCHEPGCRCPGYQPCCLEAV